MDYITTERSGHVFLIGFNRAEKMNAFNWQMLQELSEAYTILDKDPELRCGLVFAEGENFTSGLDLADVTPHIRSGKPLFPADGVDPLGLYGAKCSKPVVMAVKGYCLTIAIEMILAADICIARADAKFGQIEIKRGIFPFGGATIRLPQRAGWGNAMRYLLTGDQFDAREAYRIGLVQEVTESAPLEKAKAIAHRIAEQAPLGVYATLENARKSMLEGEQAAAADLIPTAQRLMDSEDAAEGLQSFLERRKAVFKGK